MKPAHKYIHVLTETRPADAWRLTDAELSDLSEMVTSPQLQAAVRAEIKRRDCCADAGVSHVY